MFKKFLVFVIEPLEDLQNIEPKFGLWRYIASFVLLIPSMIATAVYGVFVGFREAIKEDKTKNEKK